MTPATEAGRRLLASFPVEIRADGARPPAVITFDIAGYAASIVEIEREARATAIGDCIALVERSLDEIRASAAALGARIEPCNARKAIIGLLTDALAGPPAETTP